MAPEIHIGKDYEGASADVFAAGIILFTILTQRPPFRSAKPSDPHYKLIATGETQTFWSLHAEVDDDQRDIYSPQFKDLFEKMLSLIPTRRPTVK